MIQAVADTHSLLWYLFSDPRLSQPAREFIDTTGSQGHQIGVSAITLVEIVYLEEKRRIPEGSFKAVQDVLEAPPTLFVEAPLDRHVAAALVEVDRDTVPDMPDRIITATARALSVPVVGRDSAIRLSSVETIW